VPAPPRPERAIARHELLCAWILSALFGLLVVGRAAWDSGVVFVPSDSACVQAPWSVGDAPRNRELSDVGVAFYPHYRHVVNAWRAGELPLWNPNIYVGVPLLANPQWGVLDPQVGLLVALDAIGGEQLFDFGFAWGALLRIAGAAMGAYLLARRLGQGCAGAAFSGIAFASSGSLILWLGFSLAHVTPFMPWVLLGIEGLRSGERPARAFLLTALSMAAALYGGHPEVAFFLGLMAGIWSLGLLESSRRAGYLALGALATGVLLAAPLLVPFVEYLENSGALIAHRLAPHGRGMPDFLAIGALLLFGWFVVRWRAGGEQRDESGVGVEASWGSALSRALPLGLAFFGVLTILVRRGLGWHPALIGLAAPTSIEISSALMGSASSALVLAGLLSSRRVMGLPARVMTLGLVAWLLALEAPGVVDIWRWLPLAGMAAPARAAGCAALLLSLVSGAALERSTRAARIAAICAFVVCGFVAWPGEASRPLEAERAGIEAGDEILDYETLPPGIYAGQAAGLSGTLHGGIDFDELRLAVERLDEMGVAQGAPYFERRAVLEAVPGSEDVRFTFGELDLGFLPAGDWRFRLDFIEGEARFATRNAALVHVPGGSAWKGIGALLAAAALALLLAPPSIHVRIGLVILATIGGASLARGWNPSIPRHEHFPFTATERYLHEHGAGERFFADVGILPGDTALLRGLTTVDGYDALDVASFDGYRAYALLPGANPLIDWNASGADLASPAFELFGVRFLLFRSPQALPGWSLAAGPKGAPERTEVYIYEAEDPMPRAFCVGRIVTRASALANLDGFEPRREAFLEDPLTFEIESPFEAATVTPIEAQANRSAYRVELDGEGLFVVTDQWFPGWHATVDGEARPLLRADSIFRGILLGPGEHEVVLRYAPASLRWGLAAGAAGLLTLLLICALLTRLR